MKGEWVDVSQFPSRYPAVFRELGWVEIIELVEQDFVRWTQENWSIDQKVESVWHPVIIEECATILDNYIREHTKKYDGGTLDWNFSYKDRIVAIDSSDEISEEEQYEMAIEHFWEVEWERLTNGEG
tara:strand:- start:160 stop:540 length:381 start_codon:yes stop_codon:yes gene_type:complete